MKHIFQLSFVLLAVTNVFAQPITVSQGDFQQIFPLGGVALFYNNTDSTSVNVGTFGGPNVYDFRNVPFSTARRDSVVPVSAIPQLAPRYSSSAFTTTYSVNPGESITHIIISFSSQPSNFAVGGIAQLRPSVMEEWYLHHAPPQTIVSFPAALGSQWSDTIQTVDTTYTNGVPTNTNSGSFSYAAYIDAYGTLLLPGGLSLQCLRFRGVIGGATRGFGFLTREGAWLSICCGVYSDTGLIQFDTTTIQYYRGGSLLTVAEPNRTPEKFWLSQNYPNPFNPSTAISFSLATRSFVSLKIFDILGREVGIVVSEILPAGTHSRQWNPQGLASGVYFYRLQSGTSAVTKKLLFIR